MGQNHSARSSRAGSQTSNKNHQDILVPQTLLSNQIPQDGHPFHGSRPPSVRDLSPRGSVHNVHSPYPYGSDPPVYNGHYFFYRPVPAHKLRRGSKDPSIPGLPYDMAYSPYHSPYAVAIDPVTGRPVYLSMGGPLQAPPTFINEQGPHNTDNNVVISTYTDPRQDIIRSGSDARAFTGSTVIKTSETGVNIIKNTAASTVITTNDDNNNNNNKNKENSDDMNDKSTAIVVGGETIIPHTAMVTVTGVTVNGDDKEVYKHQSQSGLIPGKTRESKYITYIRDTPRMPTATPEVEVVEQVNQEETMIEEDVLVTSSATSQIGSHYTECFIEVGEADENLTKILIDDDSTNLRNTEELQTSVERVAVERMAVAATGLEDQSATVSFSDVTKVDLVLVFDQSGAEVARRIRDELEPAGVTVWMGSLPYDVIDEEVNDTARAILGAHMTLPLLTQASVQSRQFKDLISLAQVANNMIFPVLVASIDSVSSVMEKDLNLQLSCYEWSQLTTSGLVCLEQLQLLVTAVKEEFHTWRSLDIIDEDYGQVSSWAVRHKYVLRQTRQRKTTQSSSRETKGKEAEEVAHQPSTHDDIQVHPAETLGGGNESLEEITEEKDKEDEEKDEGTDKKMLTAAEFWDAQFHEDHGVPWDEFRSHLRLQYLEDITEQLPRSCMPPVLEILKGEITMEGDQGKLLVTRKKLIEFCTDRDEDQDVWERICDVAREHQAVMNIFDPDCSVRLTAIDGIGNHGSPPVVAGLRRLLKDTDPEIRRAAATSLSRCVLPGDQTSFSALMTALDDRDWTVRRAACLAMAHLGSPKSADRLRRIWRNDPVLHVRKSAASALAQLDGGKTLSHRKSTS